MIKSVAGIALGLLIGAGCRWLDVPVPAQPKFIGAVLVVAMTVGYLGADKVLSHRVTAAASVNSASAGSGTPPRN